MSFIDQIYTHILMCIYAKSGKYLEICRSLLHSNYSLTICRMEAPTLIDLKSA